MGARLAVSGIEGDFLRADETYLHKRHLIAIGDIADDPVVIAERLIGTPYRWGGRSGDGIDCSGLVQLALAFSGIAAPRDSDQQREGLGAPLAEHAVARRGDLVFLPGHVGIMADPFTLLHANAWWMAVVREPLADVLARLPEDQGIIARRRLTA
jgi:cell wall-associated NlpC family hydrolase